MKKLAVILSFLLCMFVWAAEREYKAGASNKTVVFIIEDANGNRKTSIDDVTTVVGSYFIEGASNCPNSVLSAGSLGAHTEWSLAAIDATKMPGAWELDLPDAAIASEGTHVTLNLDPNGQDFNDVTIGIVVVDPCYWEIKYGAGPKDSADIASDVQTGLTDQGYTTARALYLDDANEVSGLITGTNINAHLKAADDNVIVDPNVTDIWAQAMSDLSAGDPVVTEDVLTALTRLWLANFGKVVTDGDDSEIHWYNDAGAKISESPYSKSGNDVTKNAAGAND